jgi:hypothetical protein
MHGRITSATTVDGTFELRGALTHHGSYHEDDRIVGARISADIVPADDRPAHRPGDLAAGEGAVHRVARVEGGGDLDAVGCGALSAIGAPAPVEPGSPAQRADVEAPRAQRESPGWPSFASTRPDTVVVAPGPSGAGPS